MKKLTKCLAVSLCAIALGLHVQNALSNQGAVSEISNCPQGTDWLIEWSEEMQRNTCRKPGTACCK